MYNLNYTLQLSGYKVEQKIYLGVRERESFNVTDIGYCHFFSITLSGRRSDNKRS
jgi:hypothetical protein